jgi:hypothetical protein
MKKEPGRLRNNKKKNCAIANTVQYCTQARYTANEGLLRIQYKCLVPIMYSQKLNCNFQNRIIMFCLPVSTLMYSICERFIYFQDRSAYSSAGKYVDQSWEYINRSQTHECGNWD